MANNPTYCTHQELKRVYPQIDSFDTKTPLYGWVEVTTNKYAAHNSGLVTQLFADGEDLGPAQSAHTDLNVEGEWFYNSAEDICYYYSGSSPLDKLMEAGEEFTTMVTQFREDASRFLDNKLDINLPKVQQRNRYAQFDYIIVRTASLIAAAFLIRATDPTNEVAIALMEEAQNNIDDLNNGRASLSWQNTRDASRGVIRDMTYTGTTAAPVIRPVDTRGNYTGTFDLLYVKITTAGVVGTCTYSVWEKDKDKLGIHEANQVVTDELITGDYQTLAGGLEIRFGTDGSTRPAVLNDDWEIEVMGVSEHTDASGVKSVTNSRWLG